MSNRPPADRNISSEAPSKRRSERIIAPIDLCFRALGREENAFSANVSLHGLAVITDTQLPLKQFVELQLKLPPFFGQGGHQVNSTAQVIRLVDDLKNQDGKPVPGICFDFHSFRGENRLLWRRFVQSLTKQASSTPPPVEALLPKPVQENELVAFIVRPPDVPRMWAFYEFELGRGRSKVESPQGLPELSPVELVLVHPETDAEWVFSGTILSVSPSSNAAVSVLELGLNDITTQRKSAFERFIRSGRLAPLRPKTLPERPPNQNSAIAASEAPAKPRRPIFSKFFDEFAEAAGTSSGGGEEF